MATRPEPGDDRGSILDYRYTLANERTFLAWTRTSLALAAGGLGAIGLIEDLYAKEILGLLLLGLSVITAVVAYRRWLANERAMRAERPLPTSRLPTVLAVGTALVGVVGAVLVLAGEL